jgi:hypothetical protein
MLASLQMIYKMRLTRFLGFSALGFFLGTAISIGVLIAYSPDWATPLIKAKLVDIRTALQSSVNFILPGGLTKDDYSIYSKILEEWFKDEEKIPPIHRLTEWPEDVSHILLRLNLDWVSYTPPYEELREDFIERNKKQYALGANFELSKPWSFLREYDLTFDLLSEGGINYVRFSRVGYDSKKKHALVYVVHHYSCSSDLYLLFYKDDGNWKIGN